jgi:hypothetical protein
VTNQKATPLLNKNLLDRSMFHVFVATPLFFFMLSHCLYF